MLIDYKWNNPTTYLAFIPGISQYLAITGPIRTSSIHAKHERGYVGEMTSTECLTALDASSIAPCVRGIQWHTLGFLTQSAAALVAIKICAIPAVVTLAVLVGPFSFVGLALTMYAGVFNAFPFREHSDYLSSLDPRPDHAPLFPWHPVHMFSTD